MILGTWNLTLFHSGWGKIASAASMQYVIDHYSPDLIVNLGTCGGFEGVAERGDLILVDRAIVYDIVELMDASDVTNYYASSLDLSWLAEPHPYPARRGLIASADSDLLPEKIPFLKAQWRPCRRLGIRCAGLGGDPQQQADPDPAHGQRPGL